MTIMSFLIIHDRLPLTTSGNEKSQKNQNAISFVTILSSCVFGSWLLEIVETSEACDKIE